MQMTMSKGRVHDTGNMAVDARKAVELAIGYFRIVMWGDKLLSRSLRADPSVEEIEMSKDGKFWLVTLGFSSPRQKNEKLPEFLDVPIWKLKVFKVDAKTGKVLSMKIPKD